MLTANYPFLGYQSYCQWNSNLVLKGGVTGYSSVTSGSESEMLNFLVNQGGPIAVAMNADILQSYTGGIISGCSETAVDHGVTIIGYGTSAAGNPYWIVKNSWGADWGEDGFFRILRGYGECGINTYAYSIDLY